MEQDWEESQFIENKTELISQSCSWPKSWTHESKNTTFDITDPQYRKIFVGGLPHNLALQQFKDYFSQYGILEDCVILKDKRTAKPRGFGFITYQDIKSVSKVIQLRENHIIQGKWVDCKSAITIQEMKALCLLQQESSVKEIDAATKVDSSDEKTIQNENILEEPSIIQDQDSPEQDLIQQKKQSIETEKNIIENDFQQSQGESLFQNSFIENGIKSSEAIESLQFGNSQLEENYKQFIKQQMTQFKQFCQDHGLNRFSNKSPKKEILNDSQFQDSQINGNAINEWSDQEAKVFLEKDVKLNKDCNQFFKEEYEKWQKQERAEQQSMSFQDKRSQYNTIKHIESIDRLYHELSDDRQRLLQFRKETEIRPLIRRGSLFAQFQEIDELDKSIYEQQHKDENYLLFCNKSIDWSGMPGPQGQPMNFLQGFMSSANDQMIDHLNQHNKRNDRMHINYDEYVVRQFALQTQQNRVNQEMINQLESFIRARQSSEMELAQISRDRIQNHKIFLQTQFEQTQLMATWNQDPQEFAQPTME